ncbi:MAG: CDP-2,3-bis-(O-geranylgeranyl)-sn-glycerol synthase [Candidatus Altiarchaeia archaeon]
MEPIISLIIEALWFIFPAYLANSAPVDVSQIKSLKKYGTPIDGGKTFRGKRILGDGKTWRGFYAGIIAGTLVGLVQTAIQQSLANDYSNLPQMSVALAFMISLGALVGDMAESFLKRQMNLKPGAPLPLFDQLDFVFGAVFFAWAWIVISTGQIAGAFEGMLGWSRFLLILLITPLMHLITNFIAWAWKLKKDPW